MSHSLAVPNYAPFGRQSEKNSMKTLYVRRLYSDRLRKTGSEATFKTKRYDTTELMPQRNRALRHARNQIQDKAIASSKYGRHLIELLEHILVDTSAYATISLDGDGFAYAEWRAGKSCISIEIDSDGTSFFYTDMDGAIRENNFSELAVNPETAKNSLERFTRDLDSVNPSWRSYFP